MKFNWGTKIAILYIGFVVATLALVFWAMTQRVDLVTDNYYDKELKYQEQIERIQRTKNLNKKTSIEYQGREIIINFPAIPDKNISSDKNIILFYNPSNPARDLKILISTDSLGTQKIPTEKISKGFWKIKLNWVSFGKEYYDEAMINIP